VGAVPEQVNIPLHDAATSKELRAAGVEVVVRSVPEGTGRMVEAVASGEMDLALPVTDGMIAAVAKGVSIELAGVYVQSPLTWAVAAAGDAKKTEIQQLERMGVSRLGSGSHTMSYYMALLHGMDPHKLSFTVANNFTNLRAGVKSDEFDAFLWETFTTQPYFASKELTKLGNVQTPWPAFSFICNPDKLTPEQAHAVREVFFPALARACKNFTDNVACSVARISQHHAHTPEDAAKWLSTVRYSTDFTIDAKRIGHAVDVLKQAGVVPKDFAKEQLWARNPVAVVTDTSSSTSTPTLLQGLHRRRQQQQQQQSIAAAHQHSVRTIGGAQKAVARGLATAAPDAKEASD
jgi:ABC-type nitrate/sulfonate/bicarbonate transport system substrate-binding protein